MEQEETSLKPEDLMDEVDFYRSNREKISEWAKNKGERYKHIEYLLLAPDFFYLLVRLMTDDRVPFKAKFKIGVVILYYLSPFDIIPEVLLGPIGYTDDLILAVWSINSLLHSVDRQVLVENWPSHIDLFSTVERIMSVADKWLGKDAYRKLVNFFKSKNDEPHE